ncbi:MAG: alpha/beta fold hydrolase [Acidaminococcaceae bacterium]|nr:alpha/beta fold hydrolase [Acidaminococcaceae bacterium]HCJ91509.1 carboxylesterase [Acidaminococcaceae bacterium]
MTTAVRPGAGAYWLSGSREYGILLIHGFTGAPPELRLLADYLHDQGGFTVSGIRLTGHGTTVEDLEQVTCADWYGDVEKGVADLQAACRHVFVAGLSLGALLAAKAAAELPVERAALLSMPVFVYDKRSLFAGLLCHFIKRLRKRNWFYNVPEEYLKGYTEMPTKPIPGLLQLIRRCKREYLARIRVPVLIVQSRSEHTVKPKSATYIYDHLVCVPAQEKEILWLPQSGHIVTLGDERERVFAKCLEFFKKGMETEP